MVRDDDLQVDSVYNRDPFLVKFAATPMGHSSNFVARLSSFRRNPILGYLPSTKSSLYGFRIVQHESLEILVISKT